MVREKVIINGYLFKKGYLRLKYKLSGFDEFFCKRKKIDIEERVCEIKLL